MTKLAGLCRRVVRRAAEEGLCREAEAWHMTPGEMIRLAEAESRRRLRECRNLDLAAWLTGQYVAMALNAPERYPAKPDRVGEKAVGDENMRRLMMSLAGQEAKDE